MLRKDGWVRVRWGLAGVVLLATTALLGCGGGGGGGGGGSTLPVAEIRAANRDASAVLMDFATRFEEVRFEYLRLMSADFSDDFYADDLEVSAADFEAFMGRIDQLYRMEGEVLAALQQLQLLDSVEAARAGRTAYASFISADYWGELFGKYTSLNDKKRSAVITTVNTLNTTELGWVWSAVQGTEHAHGTETMADWLDKLNSGEIDWYAGDIYNHLSKNVHPPDDESDKVFAAKAEDANVGRTQLTFQVGGKAINVSFEAIKFMAKQVPGVGTGIDLMEGIDTFDSYKSGIEERLAEGKTLSQAIAETVQEKALDQGLSGEDTAEISAGTQKAVQEMERAKQESNDPVTPVTSGDTDYADRGGITFVDNATRSDAVEGDVDLAVMQRRPDLSEEDYQVGLSLFEELDADADDPDPAETTVTAREGTYDVAVVDSEGNVSTKSGVEVEAGVVKVEVVETDDVQSEGTVTEDPAVTVSLSPASVEVEDTSTLTISAPVAVVPPLRIMVFNQNEALLDYPENFTNGDVDVTIESRSFQIGVTPSAVGTYSFIVGVDDALGNRYNATISLTVTEAGGSGGADGEIIAGDAYCTGDLEFATDSGEGDLLFWTVEVCIQFSEGGMLSGTADGTVYIDTEGYPTYDVRTDIAGTWGDNSFSASGTVVIFDGGDPVDAIPGVGFVGIYNNLGAGVLVGTVTSDDGDLVEFVADKVVQ